MESKGEAFDFQGLELEAPPSNARLLEPKTSSASLESDKVQMD